MKYSRREFVKKFSIASISLSPVARLLASELGIAPNENKSFLSGNFQTDLEFHVLDKNLLNLHFYFINVREWKQGFPLETAHRLYALDCHRNSYMIVRLPQQHITEQGFWDPPSSGANAAARLSGFSFLAFQLWPDFTEEQCIENWTHTKPGFDFSVDSFLDWNNRYQYRLLTLIDWLKIQGSPNKLAQLKFSSIEKIDEKNAYVKSIDDVEIEKSLEPASAIYKLYKKRVSKLLVTNPITKHNFAPVSLWEVPEKTLLVPFFRSQFSDKAQPEFNTAFLSNNRVLKSETKYEVWLNRLARERRAIEGTSPEVNGTPFVIENPCFRAVGVVSEKPLFIPPPNPKACKEQCEDDFAAIKGSNNILPTLLDKTELAYLTQFAINPDNGLDHTSPEFDIKEINGFFFTGLGAITHLKYYNVENRPPHIDLIEYEHIITQGRDVFIKVARLGYNCKTGQKYKHVIEGTRKFTGGEDASTTFIELKQYCECIDKDFSYLSIPDKIDVAQMGGQPPTITWEKINNFTPITTNEVGVSNKLTEPAFNSNGNKVNCHYRRLPFSQLHTVEKERIPIKLLQEKLVPLDLCDLECTFWFWPVKETTHGTTAQDIPLEDYLTCECTAIDKEDNQINCSTPFMFIRASLLELEPKPQLGPELSKAYRNYLQGDPSSSVNVEQTYIGRRKIFLKKQKIGYTVSPKSLESDRNKANIIETDFIDVYFRTRPCDLDAAGKPLPAQKTPYILMPQLLRAKGYVDHVRDLTTRAIPSVLEYHNDYIEHQFLVEAAAKYANGAKSILTNTKAFVEGVEERSNSTYTEIKTALQQAKNRLGNLVAPDIIPDTISLEKFGITIPPNIQKGIDNANVVLDAAKNIQSISPYEILRGKLSEIMGGIDLREILDLLIDEKEVPVFKVSKTIADISDEVTNSPVFKTIRDQSEKIRLQIATYKSEYEKWASKIHAVQTELNTKLRELSEKIPNAEELDHLLNYQFEKFKKQALAFDFRDKFFEQIKSQIDNGKAAFREQIRREAAILRFESRTKAEELDSLRNDLGKLNREIALAVSDIEQQILLPGNSEIQQQLKDLRDQLKRLYAGLQSDGKNLIDTLYQDLTKKLSFDTSELELQLDSLLRTVEDNSQLTVPAKLLTRDPVNYDPIDLRFQKNGGNPFTLFADLHSINDAGLVQIKQKLAELELFISSNLSGDEFQTKAVKELVTSSLSLYKQALVAAEKAAKYAETESLGFAQTIADWVTITENRFRDVGHVLSATTKEAIADCLILTGKVRPFVDLLRKFDPNFYYQQSERIAKEVEGLESRIQSVIYSKYETLLKELSEGTKTKAGDKGVFHDYQKSFEELADLLKKPISNPTAIQNVQSKIDALKKQAVGVSDSIKTGITRLIYELVKDQPEIKSLQDSIETAKTDLAVAQDHYKSALQQYVDYIKAEGQKDFSDLTVTIQKFINDNRDDLELVRQAQNLYRILTSIKQQEISYKWNTSSFRDINLGFVGFRAFSDPPTKLAVDVKAVTHFTPGKFPPTIEKVTALADNRLTNFGISFFDVLTLWFSEAIFLAGSETGTKFGIKIRDVQFGGSLSFVQKLQELLATAGIPLTIEIGPDYVALGYSLIIPDVTTPSFSFFNLSLNFDIRLYFDSRPLSFGFSLAKIDRKFGIAAGIYAGFGYFGIVAQPKRGIVQMEIALEAGVWARIGIGPISGEVKMAFGFYYRKNESGVRLEGYIVAEGRLTVWILEVSARIYLGIISDNGVVEGSCTVSFTVKLGFISKTFSGTFHRKIAGAESNNNAGPSRRIARAGLTIVNSINNPGQIGTQNDVGINDIASALALKYDNSGGNDFIEETFAVGKEQWGQFIGTF